MHYSLSWVFVLSLAANIIQYLTSFKKNHSLTSPPPSPISSLGPVLLHSQVSQGKCLHTQLHFDEVWKSYSVPSDLSEGLATIYTSTGTLSNYSWVFKWTNFIYFSWYTTFDYTYSVWMNKKRKETPNQKKISAYLKHQVSPWLIVNTVWLMWFASGSLFSSVVISVFSHAQPLVNTITSFFPSTVAINKTYTPTSWTLLRLCNHHLHLRQPVG